MLFLGTAINYIDRQTLSILSPLLRSNFSLTNTDYSNIVNAFLVTYTIMYACGGRIMDWLGTRVGMALHVAWWSIAECLHALSRSGFQLGFSRALLGMGEAGEIPGSEKVIAERFPPSERSLAISIFLLGAMVGATVAPPVVVGMTTLWGWRFAFVATGLLGFGWVIGWLYVSRFPVVKSEPSNNPLTSPPALDPPPTTRRPMPWVRLFTYRATWGVMMSRFFLDATWFFYLFWLPEFLNHQKGLSLEMIGKVAWIPFLASDIGAVAGGASAAFLQKHGWSPDRSHRTMMFLGNCLLFSPLILARTNGLAMSLLWLSVGTFAIQFVGANVHTVPGQMFESSSVASVGGIAGACGSAGGMLLTRIIGYVVDRTNSYDLCLYLIGSVYPLMAMAAILVMGKVRHLANSPAQ